MTSLTISTEPGTLTAPNPRDQTALERACAALTPASEGAILAAVSQLLGCFPAAPTDAATAKTRARGYVVAMSGVSADALHRACTDWLRGVALDERDNFAFPPSPPQLRRLADRHDAPRREEVERIMARPAPKHLPLPPPVSAEEAARRSVKVDRAMAEIHKAAAERTIPWSTRGRAYQAAGVL